MERGGGGGGAFHIDCQFFELYQNSSSEHSVTLFEILNHGHESFVFFFWLSPCRFLPVLDVTFTGDWSSLTGEWGNSLTGDLHCSLNGDMFSLAGDVGPFSGDVR